MTSYDPATRLLKTNEQREETVRALGRAQVQMLDAHAEYRALFKNAVSLGWGRSDLLKSGFIDPQRLPKPSRGRSSRSSQQVESSDE